MKPSFAELLKKKGVSARQIADTTGAPYKTAWTWLRGTRVPKPFYQSEILRRVEANGPAETRRTEDSQK